MKEIIKSIKGWMNNSKQLGELNFPFPIIPPSVVSEEIVKPDGKFGGQVNIAEVNQYGFYHFGSNKKFGINEYGVYDLPKAITVLTYNIWFGENNKTNRFDCILQMLKKSGSDFICLQEVTNDFINLLHSKENKTWLKDYYTVLIPMGWYDTLILCKYKCKFYKERFANSHMERSMLFGEIVDRNGDNIVIGCMHYESMGGNEGIREDQIKMVQKAVANCKRVIIVGDYNFTDFGRENKVIDKSFVDIWLQVHKEGGKGHTMPKSKTYASWRPDHILCKFPESVDLSNAQIHIIGDFVIPPYEKDTWNMIENDNVVRTPSDHFGLFAWIPLV